MDPLIKSYPLAEQYQTVGSRTAAVFCAFLRKVARLYLIRAAWFNMLMRRLMVPYTLMLAAAALLVAVAILAPPRICEPGDPGIIIGNMRVAGCPQH